MKDDNDYIRDIAEMRSMMERTSKFLSLSGLAGIMAGLYALAGAYVAFKYLWFVPGEAGNNSKSETVPNFYELVILALTVLILAIGTAIFLSYKKADKHGEHLWNPTARRLLINMVVPLATGGLLILILISRGHFDFVAPCTLIFYGLALYNASKFTFEEVRSLGLIQIILGLLSAYFAQYALLFWSLGFGVVHIIYGIYMYYRYER